MTIRRTILRRMRMLALCGVAFATLGCTGADSSPSEAQERPSGPYRLGYRQCASDPEQLYRQDGTRDSSAIAERHFGELPSPAREDAMQGCRDALAEYEAGSG